MQYILLLITLHFVVSDIIKKPVNVAIIAGNNLTIPCITNSSKSKIHWYHTSKTLSYNKLFEGDTIIEDDFSNIRPSGNIPGQELQMQSVQMKNAGTFRCVADDEVAHAELIVLASKPACEIHNVETVSSEAELLCHVNYSGLWPPKLEWIHNGIRINGTFNDNDGKISLTLKVMVNISTDYSHFICRTYFLSKLPPDQKWASNIPDSFNCTPGDAKDESGTRVKNSGNNIWIVTGCALVACAVVILAIIFFIRKHSGVCKKLSGPDLVPQADVIQYVPNILEENGANFPLAEIGIVGEPEDPENFPEHNGAYAEVIVVDRNLPPHMQDSPAWNYCQSNNDIRRAAAQPSPALNHASRSIVSSRSATPRNGSPIVGLDGTMYLDINSVATIPIPQSQMPRRPPARLPTNKYLCTTYASIDHTSRPPPPPPPSDE